MYHQPVMLNETIEGLAISPGGIYVDVTYGGGGHSAVILEKLAGGRLIAFDQDLDAMANKIDDQRLTLINHNFRFLKNFLKYHDAMPVDGILADLGVSSHQFDVADRGFSLRFPGKLDLRMNRQQGKTAQHVLNEYSLDDLVKIFREYGELNNAWAIGNAIVKARETKPLVRFEDIQAVLMRFAPVAKDIKFFAKILQALRIEINEELEALKEFLTQAAGVLKPGGRLVVMSYHSLEDRLVKNFIKTGNFEGTVEQDFYGNVKSTFNVITRKPLVPQEKELELNSRSRSAKLRIAEKL
jgi:16S rRNA (cytosine1402-N4)-methyltransferase